MSPSSARTRSNSGLPSTGVSPWSTTHSASTTDSASGSDARAATVSAQCWTRLWVQMAMEIGRGAAVVSTVHSMSEIRAVPSIAWNDSHSAPPSAKAVSGAVIVTVSSLRTSVASTMRRWLPMSDAHSTTRRRAEVATVIVTVTDDAVVHRCQ